MGIDPQTLDSHRISQNCNTKITQANLITKYENMPHMPQNDTQNTY